MKEEKGGDNVQASKREKNDSISFRLFMMGVFVSFLSQWTYVYTSLNVFVF